MGTGLLPYNKADGTGKLLAFYGNDIVDVDTGTGYGLALGDYDVESTQFLDYLFAQNYYASPITFNGTTWGKTNVVKCPIAKYIYSWGTKIYLYDIKINSTAYRSRVWYSDLPKAGSITWGFQSGTNGNVIGGTNRFRSTFAGFKTQNLKVGDPLTIESGDNAGEYIISRISDDQMLEVTTNFEATQTSITYWAGSNWFDVNTDDGDIGKGLSENNDRLLCFKENSLYRYDLSSLRKVKGIPGTSSNRSIVNIRGVTIYFHGSTKEKTGFYMYDGVSAERISNAIQPFIEGISATNFPNVIGWREGDVYRAYVGDLSNVNSSNPAYNISKSKVILSYNYSSNRWFIDTANNTVKASCSWREDNAEKNFIQDDSGMVAQTPLGNSFDGANIPFKVETQPYYPKGSEIMSRFTRIKIVSRDARGVNVSYKLWDTPLAVDDEYYGLGDIENDTTEFVIPTDHNKGCGIQLKFSEIGTTEPTYHIEKISIYHDSDITQTPERKDQR